MPIARIRLERENPVTRVNLTYIDISHLSESKHRKTHIESATIIPSTPKTKVVTVRRGEVSHRKNSG